MTSEILIMNKHGIAMATDSAVTINGIKTYNGVNKLFMLSNNPPMGIMVFGTSTFEGIPLETLIKEYRRNINFDSINSISDIKKDFLKYIASETTNTNFDKKIELGKDSFHRFFIMNSFEWQFNGFNDFLEKYEKLEIPSFFDEIDSIIELEDYIRDLINFQNIDDFDNRLFLTLKKFFIRSYLCNNTGVVIAGFNNDNLFPSYSTFCLCANVNGKIEITHSKSRINCKNSEIIPFAEKEVIRNYLTGIHNDAKISIIQKYNDDLNNFHCELEDALNSIQSFDEETREVINGILIKSKNNIEVFNKKFKNQINAIMDDNFTNYLNSINSLPKEELANMAESLIHITSLKHKVTENIESVGGDIDVAIISKGDGFIWKKRKHYFDIDLNPQFLSR